MKIDFAIEKYLKYRRFVEKITKNTLTLHKGVLNRFANFLQDQRGELPHLDEIGLDSLIDYCEYMETAEFLRGRGYGKKVKLSHNTQVLHQHCIQKFFKWCYVSRIMNSEVYHIPVAKFKPNELVYLTHQEVEDFFEITKTSQKHQKIRSRKSEMNYFSGSHILLDSEKQKSGIGLLINFWKTINFRFKGKWIEKEQYFLMMSRGSSNLHSNLSIFTPKMKIKESTRKIKTMFFGSLQDKIEANNLEEVEFLLFSMITKRSGESQGAGLCTHSGTLLLLLCGIMERIGEKCNYCSDIRIGTPHKYTLTFLGTS